MRTPSIITFIFILLSTVGFTQVIGGRDNSEMTPQVAEATKLSGGGFVGDVNIMTGEYSASIPLGTVATPSGLSYSLELNYTSAFTFGTVQPRTAGIPYGEGWSPNIPTVSVESDVFHKFWCHQIQNDGKYTWDLNFNGWTDSIDTSGYRGRDEGDLYWFSPVISIPGVGSGRAIFKYVDVDDDNCVVFALNKFEQPLEIRYYGTAWVVRAADGTRYEFNTHLANYRAPSNQRVLFYDQSSLSGGNDNQTVSNSGKYNLVDEDVQNVIEPKASYSVWYCDKIFNTMYPMQFIHFDYETYGEFDYFQEFDQLRYEQVRTDLFNTSAYVDYKAFSDIHLTGLRSEVIDSDIDIIELEYRTLNSALNQSGMLDFTQSTVDRLDSLYSYQVVEKWYEDNNFSGWQRYRHFADYNSSTDAINSYNPYLDNTNNYYNRVEHTSNQHVPFSHGFLESTRVPETDIFPGDIYEIRTSISRDDQYDLDNGNGTIDIAIRTGNDNASAPTGSQISKFNFEAYNGKEVFSTFNSALKWQMGYRQSRLRTSNFFVMPNISREKDGLSIHIGPGNSDMDFGAQADVNNPFVTNGVPDVRDVYPFHTNSRLITSTANIPHNFGTGYPWGMMIPAWSKMALSGTNIWNGSAAAGPELFETWWQSSTDTFPDNPTRFNSDVWLDTVELIRYSKNPFMLQGVRQYKVNGNYGQYQDTITGRELVAHKQLEYSIKSPNVLKNRGYQNGDTIQFEGFTRHIILLSRLREVPMDGELFASNYGVSDTSKVLTTFLGYEDVFDGELDAVDSIYNDTAQYLGHTKYLLTTFVDHLGGITALQYYSFSSGEGSRYTSNYTRSSCADYLYSMASPEPFGRNASYSAHAAVRYMAKNDEQDIVQNPVVSPFGGTSIHKRWEYVYDTDSYITNPKQLDLPQHYFRKDHITDYDHAFGKVRVYEPAIDTLTTRNYTDYEYYGCTDGTPTKEEYLYYGKLKSAKTYAYVDGTNDELHEEKIVNYGHTLAFENGWTRPNYLRENLGYDDLLTRNYEYKDIYLDDELTEDYYTLYISDTNYYYDTVWLDTLMSFDWDTTWHYSSSGADSKQALAPNYISGRFTAKEQPKLLEFYFYDTLLLTNDEFMLESYFVKKTSEISRTYDKLLSKSTETGSNPPVVAPNLEDNPHGGDIANPISNSPSDSVLIQKIDIDRNESIDDLMAASPLSDSVLAHLLNSTIIKEKQANVLAYQGGLSNDVWELLIDKMGTFAPKSMENIIRMQPYFSDSMQLYLIDAVDNESDADLFVLAMTKNLYLTDDVVIALMNTSEFPGSSVGDILELQPQRTEAILDSIIASSNLSSNNLTRVLQNQYMSDARFEQILDDATYYEDNITDLFELTVSFPTDSVLVSVANEVYTVDNAERIMDAANRSLSQAVIDVIEDKYSRRDAGKIIPNLINSNALWQYCNNPVTESRDYIETKTEYEYYEADYTGLSVGKAHDVLLGHRSSVDDASPFPITLDATNLNGYGAWNSGFVIDSLRLKHEPSWQVFAVKTTSPHHPGAYNREEYFYLYDLQNRYDRFWYNYDLDGANTTLVAGIHELSPGSSIKDTLVTNTNWHSYYQGTHPNTNYPMPRQHDGMERSRTHGNKVLAFQKATHTKNSRDDDPLIVSEYYQYDRRWKYDDLPTTPLPDTFDFGDSCQYLPAPPTTIDDCEDCYEIFFKPFMDPKDVTPTYHCLWHIPGYGYYICDNDIDWTTIDSTATEVYCDNGLAPGVNQKALTYSIAMDKALLLRSVSIQIDTLSSPNSMFDSLRVDTKNMYVAEFDIDDPLDTDSLGFNGAHDMVYPYHHLVVRTVRERNRYTQPKLEENQVGLLTRYEYNKSTRYVNWNENCTSDSYGSTLNEDIGLPTRITIGHTKADSMSTAYAYNEIGQVESLTSPSGKLMEYTFDNYHRLIKISEINKQRILSRFKYHNWLHVDSVEFDDRTNENWVQTQLYNSDTLTDTLDYEFRKAFLDPLARNHSVVSAYWNTPTTLRQIHSGSVKYDNWGRTTHAYKNYTEDLLDIKASYNDTMPYAESIFQNDPKSRATRASNYGVDVTTNPVVKTDYCLTNNVFTSCELELSFTELPLIMGPGATANYRFFRTEIQDQNDKRSVEYLNALGQKVATLKYNDQNEKIITLFVYDSYGNVTQVINPEKQDNTFEYNMLGQLVKETSVDAGTKRYMYNKQGLVSVDQDANARTHTINDSLAPYYRVYDYDDYGRLLSVGRKETGFPYSNSNIYDPLYYETVFIDDAATNPNYIDTGHYFDYTYSNASSQDWLTTFEVWDTIVLPPYYGNVEVSGFDTQFGATVLEKAFVYGGNTAYNTIGQVVESYSYDDKGIKVQGTIFAYDSLDNLASQTVTFDPAGIDDTTGNLLSIIEYPDYNYRRSLLEQKVDVNGDNTVDFHCFMQYDYLNRLSSIRASAGEVDSLELATLLVSYSYDDANGLVEKKEHYLDQDNSGIVSRLVNEIEYSFDVRDRLTETQVGQLSLGLNPLMHYSMYYDDQTPYYVDSTGNLETVNYSNNYNGNINGTLMKYDFYGTDVNTNISTFDKPTLYGYTYDKINRLTNADATVGDYLVASGNPDYAISYQIGDLNTMYDRIGNIQSLDRMLRTAGGGSYGTIQEYDYSYSAGNNRLMEATGLSGTTTRTYGYDANGNLLKDNFRDIDTTEYGRAAYPYHIDLGGEQIDYLYSVDDQRIYKYETESTNTVETYYLMDAMGKTVAIYTLDSVGSWQYFISGAERECRLAPRTGQIPGANGSTTTPSDLAFLKGQASYYYYDHLGNTRMVCSPDGYLIDTTINNIDFVADYFPYGKVLREYSGTDEERYLTTQHERDRNTGLDYRGARYYDSDIGRFLSLDPLAAKFPEWNAYNYVLGNPVVFVDPDGKAPEWIPIEKNGTIVLKPEQGDNAASLASFLHVGKETATMLYNSRCSDGTVELSGVVENINIIENAIQDTKENPDNYDGYFDRNYDCHESSISLANSEYINYDNVVEGWELSKELRKDGGRKYTDVTDSPSKYRFAETLIRLGNSAGNTTHSATYLGTSKDGTIYTWSKNGNSSKPSIQTLESLVKLYSSMVQGISEESGGGFYNANY